MLKKKTIFIITIILTTAIIALIARNTGNFSIGAGQNLTSLTDVEIREYQGDPLSSISDFRENSIAGPQYINITEYRLNITGLVERPQSLTYDSILQDHPHYKKKVTLYCVEGWQVTILWEGVLVEDLIAGAGIKPGANTVIFRATDGYSTSFPLDYLIDREIIIAHTMNNVTLPASRGYPFQLVAEDRWGYKWIKWITEIEISDDPEYSGYWEQRGYSNSGELNRSFFP